MSIELAVSLYLLVGLIDWFFGHASRQIHEMLKTELRTVKDSVVSFKWLRVVFVVSLIFFGSIALYPIFYLIILYDRLNAKKGQLQIKDSINLALEFDEDVTNGKLYFWQTNGVGDLHCKTCHHTREITSFIHSRDWAKTGMQCEACGQFTSVSPSKESPLCSCGGKLLRDEAIFCPACRSHEVEFTVIYMT